MEKEIYYFPVYKYRGIAGIEDAIMELTSSLSIKNKSGGRKFIVYSSEERAIEAGKKMLCDDDSYNVMRIEFGGEHRHPTIIDEHFCLGEKITYDISVEIVKEDLLIDCN